VGKDGHPAWIKSHKKQRQKQIQGFFASLRMMTKTRAAKSNDKGAKATADPLRG
jgi:hypothetical protein